MHAFAFIRMYTANLNAIRCVTVIGMRTKNIRPKFQSQAWGKKTTSKCFVDYTGLRSIQVPKWKLRSSLRMLSVSTLWVHDNRARHLYASWLVPCVWPSAARLVFCSGKTAWSLLGWVGLLTRHGLGTSFIIQWLYNGREVCTNISPDPKYIEHNHLGLKTQHLARLRPVAPAIMLHNGSEPESGISMLGVEFYSYTVSLNVESLMSVL